ncbi:hypothetical protein cypCar_00007624 [Cyprinus carpio]|nr:hypothetical protein cypCar_00007624 [Cyprinus carpio]
MAAFDAKFGNFADNTSRSLAVPVVDTDKQQTSGNVFLPLLIMELWTAAWDALGTNSVVDDLQHVAVTAGPLAHGHPLFVTKGIEPTLEMPKRRDILAIVLIVLPWTLLITVWHQSAIAPLLAIRKDDGTETRHETGPATDSKEYCSQDKDIVEVVRTEYVYTRPPPWSDVLPTIHVITPTYSRPVQKAELTRLANTFLHVPNLHWILVEDSQRRTPLVTRLLRETGLNYTHLNVETPRNYKLRGDTRDPRIPRGTMQRNLALRWLRETFNSNNSQTGIVYFADDDNTYSLELFEEVS